MFYERKRKRSLKPMCFLVFATLRKVCWKSQDAQKERLEPKQPQSEFLNLKKAILQKRLFDVFFNFSRELSEELPEDPRNDKKAYNRRVLRAKTRKRFKTDVFFYERKREKGLQPSVFY